MNPPFPSRIPPRPERLHPLASATPILGLLAALILNIGTILGKDTNEISGGASPGDQTITTPATTGATLQAAVAAARERAKLLHDVYSTTLDVMHVHYFRRDGPVLPARAMEDVFTGVAGLSGSQANWISVNTTAMSINHEPTTAFEKKAAAELAAGKKEYEYVGKGVYRRAAPIPLRTSCVGCHTKMFSEPPKSPRFAGLVISIPLKLEEK